ncbi:Kdo2-lipid IVA lauroyltransferase/acyltransferase [Gammaproteobacteria bacterium]
MWLIKIVENLIVIRNHLIWIGFRLFAALPQCVVRGLGIILGMVANLFPNPVRRIIEINLRLCFPELQKIERQRLVRRTLIETGKTFTEMGALWTWELPKVLALVKKVSGEDAFQAALAQGRGAITAGPHLGAWEMAGLYLSKHYPVTTLYRPPRLAGLGERVRLARARGGARLVATDIRGVKSLYQSLMQGEVVAILPDHNPGQGMGVFAPFFGISANTMVLLSRLANKNNVPVFFVYAERLPRGQGFHIHFVPGDQGINDTDIERSCACLNAGVEECIRRHPEQYQWSYKRFKIRPEGEADLYKKK